MRVFQMLATCGVALALATAANAQEIDWKKVDTALGKTATVSGEVHRYGLPRSDLLVTVDGVTIIRRFFLPGSVDLRYRSLAHHAAALPRGAGPLFQPNGRAHGPARPHGLVPGLRRRLVHERRATAGRGIGLRTTGLRLQT